MSLGTISFTQEQLDIWFAPLKDTEHIALGVSGGGDSVAMMVLVKQWLGRARVPKVTVLSVNHNLRPQAGMEAEQACVWARALGFEAVVLEWHEPRPCRGGLQAAAREARYGLMFDWCGARGVRHLGLAHTVDDQAETFMMRLARGSGVDGLSAMAPLSARGGINLIRPLLGVGGRALRDMLTMNGHPWLDDPSNEMARFERVRLRKSLKGLEADGLRAEKIALSAHRLGRARAALDEAAHLAADKIVSIFDAGFCVIDVRALLRLPEEICLRVLKTCLTYIGANMHRPRLEQVEALYGRLQADIFCASTLAGCRLLPVKGDMIIAREAGRQGLSKTCLAPGARHIWDRRFEVALSAQAKSGMEVHALGSEGWRGLKKAAIVPHLRAALAHGLISFWRKGRLVAVPHIDFYADGAARDEISLRACAPPALGKVRILAEKSDNGGRIFTNSG